MVSTIESKILDILTDVTQTDEVQRNLDLALFDDGVLDSLGMVGLILSMSDEFGIKISPAEVDRNEWSSPRKIVAYIQRRMTP